MSAHLHFRRGPRPSFASCDLVSTACVLRWCGPRYCFECGARARAESQHKLVLRAFRAAACPQSLALAASGTIVRSAAEALARHRHE
eukprot:3813269-Pleurochrysis_carterae.AAC.2